MPILTTRGAASTAMKSVLPRAISPLDVAQSSWCDHLWLFRPEANYSTVVADEFDRVNNLADASAYVSAVETDRRPAVAEDADLGMQVAVWDDSLGKELLMNGTIDPTQDFTYLVVTKAVDTSPAANQVVMGHRVSAPDVASILNTPAGNLQAQYGTAGSASTPNPGTWSAVFMSHDAAAQTVGVRVGNDDFVFDESAYTAISTADALRFGWNYSNGYEGSIALGAVFNCNLADPANASEFAEVRSMIDRYFGGRIAV